MAWRFRTSFTPIPGVRLTLSPSGITTSVGVGPLRLTSGPRGTALSATIPRTGLSLRQPLSEGRPRNPTIPSAPRTLPSFTPSPPVKLNPVEPFSVSPPVMQAIQSAGSNLLMSPGLAAFKQTLEQAQRQFASTEREFIVARGNESVLSRRYLAWENGWFLKRLLKKRFEEMSLAADDATAMRQEFEQQMELSRLHTQFEMPDGVSRAFSRASDDFVAMTRSERIWDNVAHRSANKFVERTTASRVVDLKPVRFGMGKCGVIETSKPMPHLQNANGGDIFLYPGFLAYVVSPTNYALIEYGSVKLSVVRTQFHEEHAVPSDAQQVGSTWAKANKDGTPDRRFKDNYAIPVMQYARLELTSTSGLNEEYMLSNVGAAEAFQEAWNGLVEAVKRGV